MEIGKAEDGRPSIKVEGVEMSFLVGDDVTIRFIKTDADPKGHWELALTFIDPELALQVNTAAAKGKKRASR